MNKIHVCFFIDLDTTISKWESVNTLFDTFCKDDLFKVSILKESDRISNTYNNFLDGLDSKIKIYTYFKNNKKLNLKNLNIDYLFIYCSYDKGCINWFDWKDKIKICFIEYGTTYITKNIESEYYLGISGYVVSWRIFLENDFMFNNILKYNKSIKKENLVVSGKPKFDYILKDKKCINQNLWRLDKKQNPNAKRVIWSPHWTIKSNAINHIPFSKFLKYADLWLKIPKLYPDLDIILKPHPMLFANLEWQTNGVWNNKKLNDWKKDFLSNPNTQIMEDGLYDDLFLTSDAIINDSVSFIVEYLPTLKPFLECLDKDKPNWFSEYGEKIINSYYKAYEEKDILNFIEDVVFKDNDFMLEDRKKALKDNLFLPKEGSATFIKNYLKNDFNKNNINVKEIFKEKYNNEKR